jgi:hypothetical protein
MGQKAHTASNGMNRRQPPPGSLIKRHVLWAGSGDRIFLLSQIHKERNPGVAQQGRRSYKYPVELLGARNSGKDG